MEPCLAALPAATTARLHLRPLTVADAASFREMTDDPNITDMIDFLSSPFTIAAAEALLSKDDACTSCFWGVWSNTAPALIGTVGAHLRGDAEIEIGYWFSPAMHGRGYAVESVGLILSVLIQAYPARRIYAECRPTNTSSWRLLTRAGFHDTGLAGHRSGRSKLIWSPEGKQADES